LLTPTTTLGHIAALPVIVDERDALILDRQVHNSVQTAARLGLTWVGGVVAPQRHRPPRGADPCTRRAPSRVWFAVDGLYSMYGDFAPIRELNALVERHEQLWLYIDDAHGFSWTARAGPRVAGSMVKSFGAASSSPRYRVEANAAASQRSYSMRATSLTQSHQEFDLQGSEP
jgi:7-keto-8-aminopelargonate synthetase-like enzyme